MTARRARNLQVMSVTGAMSMMQFEQERKLQGAAMTQHNLLARTYHRILKLARTIVVLEGCEEIQSV